MNRKVILTAVMLATLLISSFAYASPEGVYNDPNTPDTTGFTYYYIPQVYPIDKPIDYSDPQLLFKIVLTNTMTEPNLLKDSSGNLFDTYNFADLGAVQTDISGVNHYVLTISTTANTTQQPTGVTESKSGVYHYGSITLPDGRVIKFWVVDTVNAGQYDKVFVDVDADLVIDFTNLGVGSYFVITDQLGGKMQIVIHNIASDGKSIQIYNNYDNLQSGASSPLDGTPLKPVMKPHWVAVGIDTKTIANVHSVDFLVEASNGSLRTVHPSDYFIGSYDAVNGVINGVILLGDYVDPNGVYIPAERTVYALAHLEPVTYDVVKTYDSNTNETILTITLHNNAGMSLGAGYIKIENIAPIDSLTSISNTLKVVSGSVVADVEAGVDSVNLVLKFNSLAEGDTQVVLSYKYVNPLTDIQQKVDENNEMIKDLYNITNDNVVKMLDEIVKDNQQILAKLQNGTQVDLTPIQSKLDSIDQNVQNNANAINGINDQLQSISNDISDIKQQLSILTNAVSDIQTKLDSMNSFDVQAMITQLSSEIQRANAMLVSIQNQLNSMSVPASAGAGDNATAGDNGGGVVAEDQFTAQLQSQLMAIQKELSDIQRDAQKFTDKTSPFIVMMYYNKVLIIENQLNNLLWTYNSYVLQSALTGKIDQVNGKLGSLTTMVTNMQNSVLTSVNKVPATVGNTINQKLTPVVNDIKNIKMLVLVVIVIEVGIIALAFKKSKKEEEEGAEQPMMPGMMPGMGPEQMGGQMMGGQMGAPGMGGEAFGGQQQFGGFGMPEQ